MQRKTAYDLMEAPMNQPALASSARQQATITHARAAVVEQKDGPFIMQDIALEAPRADEVLIRMVATGICATDSHVRQQLMPSPLPAILGHEGAGVVMRTGASVAHLKPGDHVVLSYHSCGQCKPCLSSHAAYCEKVWEANFAGARLDGTSASSDTAPTTSTRISSASRPSRLMRWLTSATPSKCRMMSRWRFWGR